MSSEISEKIKLIDLLKKNFKLLLSLLILLFVIISILLWFDYSNKSKREKISENFIRAKILLENQQNIKAHNVLKNIVEKKDNIYSPLSLFLIIEKNLEKDKATITNYFDKILNIGSIEKEDLNLLRLKKAIFISENSKEEDVLELLNPIINSDSVWKIQSIKFLGDYYFSLKQFNKAKQYYLILISNNDIGLDKNEIKRKLNIIGDE
jgi:hypothetical protein